MARSRSQWDFGELFPAAETRQVLSVTDLTARVKRLVEKEFGSVFVSGEISNWRLQSSGHAYFVLKDAGAQLNCVLFRGTAGVERAFFRDGAHVLLGGELTVYEPRGTYQMRVTSAEAQGMGALQAAFERLKAKLDAEGLFAADRKRRIPEFPRRVGLVTSPTGAAIQDVLHVVGRRFAGIEFVLVPVRVQGQGAAVEIAEAIGLLNRWSAGGEADRKTTGPVARADRPMPRLDVILVTRGGGSLEDLWCFNEEVVARAIAASAVPVLSAVGHEIDFTIADLVADLRAATPSAAAEILTQAYVDSAGFVAVAGQRLRQWVRRRLVHAEEERRGLARRFLRAHPRRRLEERGQRLDDLATSLARMGRTATKPGQAQVANLARRLAALKPATAIARQRRELAEIVRRLSGLMQDRLAERKEGVARLGDGLRLLSPLSVLQRGYSITLDAESGAVVRDAAGLAPGRRLKTRLARGEVASVVEPGPSVKASPAR